MDIVANEGLSSLKNRVKSEFNGAINERNCLGLLTPKNFKVHIQYYGTPNTNAVAYMEDDLNPCIELNILPLVYEKYNGKKESDLQRLIEYFDITRCVFPEVKEPLLLSIMKHPSRTITDVEQNFNKTELNLLKQNCKQKGVNYDEVKDSVIKIAKPMRKLFKELKPFLRDEYKNSINHLGYVRHELDHLDFFKTHLRKKYGKLIDLEEEVQSEGDDEAIKKLNRKLLKMESEVTVLAEIRAIYFDNVPFNEWDKIDDNIKRKVYGDFHNRYIEGPLNSRVMNYLLNQRRGSSELTPDTSNYLKMTMLYQLGDVQVTALGANSEKVNFSLANHILYEDIPKWKKKFANNAEIATDVLGDVFRSNPEALNKAKNAKSFNEYVRIIESRIK